MNVFDNYAVASGYDNYYETDFGRKVDFLEKRAMSELIKDIPRNDMLELGCGTGHWTEYFVEQGFNVIATDSSKAMLNIAKNKQINADFITSDAQNLPFNNNTYSVIASVTMLEFTEDQESAIQEMYRVLKHEGWLILGCLNSKSVLGIRKEKDEIFKNSKLLDYEFINSKLELFGQPVFNFSVYLTKDGEFHDYKNYKAKIEPVFFAVKVKKTK